MLILKILCLYFHLDSFANQDIQPGDIGPTVPSTESITRNYNDMVYIKEAWHKERKFVDWLISGVIEKITEVQTYDGWYNNPSQPSLGSAGTTLIRLLPPAYEDGIKNPVNRENANPLVISERLMKKVVNCGDCSTLCSKTGKNVLMIFFGLFVMEEIVNTRRPSCPPEYFNMKIPEDHFYNQTNLKEMPFVRSQYDKKSGLSPNNPREQLNFATSWIDGSVVYGSSKAWTNSLRSFENGQLKSSDVDGLYPLLNNGYLSFLNPVSRKRGTSKNAEIFRIGNPFGHENPFVLTFSILFFRWHNLIAKSLCQKNINWKDEDCFTEARKWVIATLQHIIVDEWLPELLGEKLDKYENYDPSIQPGVSHSFESAAMKFLHVLIPSGVYNRISASACQNSEIRLCNSYYDSKKILVKHGIESMLLGMVFQAAEVENITVVDDIRKFLYGPLEFSHRDIASLNIHRSRDHGLPGYATARKYLLPNENIFDFNFEKMSSMVNPVFKELVMGVLPQFYKSPDDVDLWVGGLLETDTGPGPIFKVVLKDQFLRIRDGDRFWFENEENGLFTDDDMQHIKNITMYDIILAVSKDMYVNDIQKAVFHVPIPSAEFDSLNCSSVLRPYECHHFGTTETCFSLPALVTSPDCLNIKILPECFHAEPTTYDYFTGSGAAFILSFLFLFLFIIGCIMALIILVNRRQREEAFRLQMVKLKDKRFSSANSICVTEWIDKKEGVRQVAIQFNADRKLISVCLLNGQTLRCIDLSNVQMVQLQISISGKHHFVLIRIAREYDMIWRFDVEEEKLMAVEKLENFLGSIGIGRTRHDIDVKRMLKNAVTKADRQALLEQFFRTVFAQAFSIEHTDDLQLNLDSNHIREIISTELTPFEFAEALSLRPDALFVRQMFELVDTDGNGYISFREFLNMIIIFAKGRSEDKMKLMFDIYDIDHSGKLTREEFSSMIRSLLELANQSLPSNQLDQLVASMFKTAGLQNKAEITFDDFSHLLADHREELGYIQLSFDVGEGFKTGPTGPQGNRKSVALKAQETVLRAYGRTDDHDHSIRHEKGKSIVRMETKPTVYETDHVKQNVSEVIRFMENYNRHIFWALLYTLITFGIFIEKAYYYSVESEHSGLRRIAGYGVTVTRGAASAMMFAFATILLSMCRNTITFLRETFLHKYIPFDAAILFHKFIAFWALLFTLIHAIGHGINFYHVSTQTPSDLQCLFNDFHLSLEHPPKFQFWLFQTITGTTAIFLVLVLSLMYVFAVQFARRHVFNAFWKTHNLYPLLYVLMILHGLGRLVQDPIFYYYFVGPLILFVIDRLVSVSRKKVEISVIKAELLPSGVTHLEFKRPANFEYRSGQWVRIACVPLNGNEYHPFTLSSAPHEENLSLHIRAVGPWTINLRNIYDPNNLQQHAYPKIYLDGPYGEGHQDWFRYDVSVLVGGGIGITPFASILKDVAFKSSVKAKFTCKKIYFIWVTRTQKHFEWMTDIIQEVEKNDRNRLVDVHIFITQFYQKFDLRTTMLYICERHFQRISGRSLFTGLQSTTHFGRPDFKTFLESLQQEHPDVSKIAVFSCGPPLMTRSVQSSCDELNKHEGAIFIHHFENF